VPNGLNISRDSDEWRRLESPMLESDSLLTSFAERHKMLLTRNHHNWPERTLSWSSAGLRRSIQILLDNPCEQTYSVCVYASAGAGQTWLSNELFLKRGVPWSDVAPTLEALLKEAYDTSERWSQQDLNSERRIDVGAILRRRPK
jgi:hypothetical protein